VRDANEMFYGLIESTIFRIAILGREESEESKAAISLAIKGISIST